MGIPSRERLEDREQTTEKELALEHYLFQTAMKDMPGLSEQQKNEFSKGGAFEGTVFADLQDDTKQQQLEDHLGTGVLRSFEQTKYLSMIRNDAIHDAKRRGIATPEDLQDIPLDVTHPSVFNESIEPLRENNASKNPEAERESIIQQRLEDRAVYLDTASDQPLYSFSDESSKTLYVGGENDALHFDSPHEFTYDEQEMGSGTQALQYAKALYFNDVNRALSLTREPMNRDELARKGLLKDPYKDHDNQEQWNERKDSAIQSIVQAKMDNNRGLKDALKQTKGYRLAYADENAELGIGVSLRDVTKAGRDAAWNNEPFHIQETNPDTNNRLGNAVENVRRNEIEKEQALQKDAEQTSPQNKGAKEPIDDPAVFNENPFSSGQTQNIEDVRSMDFSSVDDPVVDVEEDEPSTNIKEPLEVSFHAGENLTPRGQQRASEAARRFADEAKDDGREAVIHVAKNAPAGLKKAVYQHRDQLSMKELDLHNMPDRSLLVQHDRRLTPAFKDEMVAMTKDSKNRDVRALDVDPKEPDAYGINHYLLHVSDKTQVSPEADPFVPDGSEKDHEREALKRALQANDRQVSQAQNQAGQTAVKERQAPSNGVYESDPFQ